MKKGGSISKKTHDLPNPISRWLLLGKSTHHPALRLYLNKVTQTRFDKLSFCQIPSLIFVFNQYLLYPSMKS